MHVAYLINQYPQPSQSFIRREAAALAAAGTRISRFTIRRPVSVSNDPRDQAESERTRAVLDSKWALISSAIYCMAMFPGRVFNAFALAMKIGRTGQRGRLMHLIYLAEACVIFRWCLADDVDHIHAHFGTNSATVAMLVAELGGPGYSFTVHGPEEFDDPKGLSLGEKIARSRFTVAISQFGRSQLLRWCDRADWDRVHVIRCGVDELFLSADFAVAFSSQQLVNVGRLVEQKGQLVLLEAAALVARRGVDFSLLIIGDGPMRADLEDAIQRLGLTDRVTLLGWRSNDQVRDLLIQSRAMVMPSFAEGLPVALMECLALGRPVVTTYVGGTPELVTDHTNGLLVPAGDATALADAMVTVLNADASTLDRWGRQGHADVARRHDVRIEARKLQSLIIKHFNATSDVPQASPADAH